MIVPPLDIQEPVTFLTSSRLIPFGIPSPSENREPAPPGPKTPHRRRARSLATSAAAAAAAAARTTGSALPPLPRRTTDLRLSGTPAPSAAALAASPGSYPDGGETPTPTPVKRCKNRTAKTTFAPLTLFANGGRCGGGGNDGDSGAAAGKD